MKKEKRGKETENKKNTLKKAIALSQISMMILEVFAFAFIISGMMIFASGNVSAEVTEQQIKDAKVHANFKRPTQDGFDFAQEIYRLLGKQDSLVEPVSSDVFVRPAPRPTNSTLSNESWSSAGLPPMSKWKSALKEAMPSIILQIHEA